LVVIIKQVNLNSSNAPTKLNAGEAAAFGLIEVVIKLKLLAKTTAQHAVVSTEKYNRCFPEKYV
jgi:hypothetical protein